MYNLTENVAIAATIDPQLIDDTSVTSDWVDMSKYRKVSFIVNVGATDTTFGAKLQEATDSSGTSNTDLTWYAITQLTATDDNEQVVIEIDAQALSKQYVALLVTAGDGTEGVNVSAVGLGYFARDKAVDHLASVAEVVSTTIS